MKGLVKALIIGAVIIGLGIAILLIGLGLNGWKFNRIVNFEMQNFTEAENNDKLDINISAGRLKTEFYDGDKITVDYATAEGYTYTLSEKGGTLVINTPHKKWFYWGISAVEIPETVIKIPSNRVMHLRLVMNAGTVNLAGGEYKSVDIDMNAGTFKTEAVNCGGNFKCDVAAGTINFGSLSCDNFESKISAGTVGFGAVTCNKFEAKLSAGAFDINGLTAETSSVKISAGSLDLNFTGAKSEYTITKSISAGSCNVDNQTGSTNKSIDIKVSAGKATLNFQR